jgi:hypothetical protein
MPQGQKAKLEEHGHGTAAAQRDMSRKSKSTVVTAQSKKGASQIIFPSGGAKPQNMRETLWDAP